MARILCITTGLTGMLNASLELVSRLQAAGHDVTYGSPSPVCDTVQAHGFRFVQLPPFTPNPVPPLPVTTGPFARIREPLARWAKRSALLQAGIDALEIDEHARIIEAQRPDLVLADIEVHESILAARSLGLQVALLSQWFSTWKRPGLPPITSDLTPSSTSVEVSQAWRDAWIRVQRQALGRRKGGRLDRGDVLLEVAKQAGFPRRELQRTAFPPPFVYRTMPVLSMTLEEAEFPHEQRPSLHYVGPMVFAQREDQTTAPEIDEIIERCTTKGVPLVYCTVSSMNQGDVAFLQKLVRVFERRPDWMMVAGLGRNVEPEALGPLPPNVAAFSWTPQLRLLEAAACSVNHGGIHTINECIHFGVPMVVYSGQRYDQNGCAARVAYHGLGLRGDKDRDDADRIEAAIDRVLSEPVFREAMGRFQQHYERARQSRHLERTIDALLEST